MDREKLRRFERDLIVWDVAHYLSKLEAKGDIALLQRLDEQLDPANMLQYFKSRERLHNVKLLLQYMLDFLKRPPHAAPDSAENAERFRQFRSFVRFQADLLLEDDVGQSLESAAPSPGGTGEPLPVRERAKRFHDELRAMLEQEWPDSRERFVNLFAALRRLSLFWFDLHGMDPGRMRKSDVYIYLLGKLLLAESGHGDDPPAP